MLTVAVLAQKQKEDSEEEITILMSVDESYRKSLDHKSKCEHVYHFTHRLHFFNFSRIVSCDPRTHTNTQGLMATRKETKITTPSIQ